VKGTARFLGEEGGVEKNSGQSRSGTNVYKRRKGKKAREKKRNLDGMAYLVAPRQSRPEYIRALTNLLPADPKGKTSFAHPLHVGGR